MIAYRTREAPESSRALLRRGDGRGPIAAVVFTSGSTVRGLVALGQAESIDVGSIPAVCIGPETADEARAAGFRILAVSPTPDAAALAATTAPRSPSSHRRSHDARPRSSDLIATDRPAAACRSDPADCGARRPSARSSARPGSILDAGRAAVRAAGRGRPRADRVDARGQARLSARPRRRGGRAPGRARRRRRHPLRPARVEGCARLRGIGRGRDRPGRVPADPRARAAARDDRRHVPVRVHRPRPLRPARGRRRRRQRRRARPARRDRREPGARRRRHRRAERDDGRPGRGDPRGARRRGLRADRDHGLRLEARLGLLRPVPRGGRQRAGLRRPARLPDGPRQRSRGDARDGARRRRGRRHPARQAGAARARPRSPRRERGSTCRSPPTRCPASTR